jgi:hypothetical protein
MFRDAIQVEGRKTLALFEHHLQSRLEEAIDHAVAKLFVWEVGQFELSACVAVSLFRGESVDRAIADCV